MRLFFQLQAGNGHFITRGPGTYKIPTFGNIPQQFNVTLLKDLPNLKAVYSSKVRLVLCPTYSITGYF